MFEPGSSLADVRVNLAFLEEEGLLERLAVTANVLCHQQIVLRPTPAYAAARPQGSSASRHMTATRARSPTVTLRWPSSPRPWPRPVGTSSPAYRCELWMEGDGEDPAAAGGTHLDPLSEVNNALTGAFGRLLDGLSSGELLPGQELADAVIAETRDSVTQVRLRERDRRDPDGV